MSSAAGSPSYCPALPQKAQSQPRGTRHPEPLCSSYPAPKMDVPFLLSEGLSSGHEAQNKSLHSSLPLATHQRGLRPCMYGSSTPLHSAKTMNCAPKIQSFSFFRSFPPCCCWVWVTTGPTTRPVFDPRAREPVNPRLGLSSRRGSSALQCARPKDLTLS